MGSFVVPAASVACLLGLALQALRNARLPPPALSLGSALASCIYTITLIIILYIYTIIMSISIAIPKK